MKKSDLIKKLAEQMGVTPFALEKWRQRQIPHKWRIPLMQAAKKAGHALVPADFEKGMK